MSHDIIDNRTQKLADQINVILPGSDKVKFAVGYFFLSGFQGIYRYLDSLSEIRLLIGNVSNKETIEQLSEGYKSLKLIENAVESLNYPKTSVRREMVADAQANAKDVLSLMDQTDDNENVVTMLIRLIEQKRLKVKVYTKGRLHSKAYIFDYKGSDNRYEKGIAIVGSSNLTLAGITSNTELNVVVSGNDNHKALTDWFGELWDESKDFDEALMHELKRSWAAYPVKPYDIYMKTLFALTNPEEIADDEIVFEDRITDELADFQKGAVRVAIQMFNKYNGCFLSDVVGLGKSYMGAAVVKHFVEVEHARPLIICPSGLTDMWDKYNEKYALNARVLSMGMLSEKDGRTQEFLSTDELYRDRDFVLVDESHNFRYSDTQRYKMLESFLRVGKKCVFLTATPRNKSAWDIYNQMKLFYQEDKIDILEGPPNLKKYFKGVEEGSLELSNLLSNFLVRRTRTHILRWYGYDSETNERIDPNNFDDYKNGKKRAYVKVGGKKQFFPKRELETIEYSIENTYNGLYEMIRDYIGKPSVYDDNLENYPNDQLTYARYGLWNYLKAQKRSEYKDLQSAGINLRGLIKVMLFKRFESSVYAFKETIRRLIKIHNNFQLAMKEGIVPAGDDARSLLYGSDDMSETELMDAIKGLDTKYYISDFNFTLLQKHINQDIDILSKIYKLVENITPEEDDKLQVLLDMLESDRIGKNKCLIFSQYSDTARYLYRQINPDGERDDIVVVYSGKENKSKVVGRFSPKSNPELAQPDRVQIKTLIATDVLAEGLNLQDCNILINYDLHWNPVRLIQRFGRIDRIGSDHDNVWAYNFLPELGIEKNLGLKNKLQRRIQEIHNTIGEDAAILDKSEQINENAMYAIYESKDSSALDEEEEIFDINEAREFFRKLKEEDPSEYERIASLRDGIRASKEDNVNAFYVYCKGDNYNKFYLVDMKGTIQDINLNKVISLLKCEPTNKGYKLPNKYNQSIMKAKSRFDDDLAIRNTELRQSSKLTQIQSFAIKELKALWNSSDGERRGQIAILEKTFRRPLTTAIRKELNSLKRNNIVGEKLYRHLVRIYYHHRMSDWSNQQANNQQKVAGKIICSEALKID